MLVAAVDQGSSATKGAVFDAEGRVLATASVAVAHRTAGERLEQDPLALLGSVREVLARLSAAGPLAAFALACQRSTCLLWERDSGAPLTPALSWQDRGEAAAAAALEEEPGVAEEVARRTGLRLSPHYAALKLRRLLAELPDGEVRARDGALFAGTLDAFLVHRLTGRASTEPGQAGRTLLYDLESDRWDPWLCARFAVPAAALPEILPSAGERGAWEGIPLAALLGDQQAALLGWGGWTAGTVGVHLGTGAFVLGSTGTVLRRAPALLAAVVAEGLGERRFQLEAPVNSAGSAVDWVRGLTGQSLAAYADPDLDPATLPLVLPAFAGAAAPWWRPRARAAFAGLELSTGAEDLLAATLAGVAQRVLDGVEALAAAGARGEVLRASGKLGRLRGLTGLLADLGQVPVEVCAAEETGLVGAARLARAVLTADLTPLARAPEVGHRREPRWSAERAQETRARWRRFVAAALDLA